MKFGSQRERQLLSITRRFLNSLVRMKVTAATGRPQASDRGGDLTEMLHSYVTTEKGFCMYTRVW